jgi:hypothetical protein
MQDALETFEAYASVHQWINARSLKVMYALRDRLAQPEPEPVAWLIQYSDRHEFVWGKKPVFLSATVLAVEPLYTAPSKREWVGLTDEDKHYLNEVLNLQGRFPVIDAIEAKLRSKNT